MAFIKFKDSEEFIKAVVLPVDNHVVRITADAPVNLSGFRLYLRDNEDYPLDNGEYEPYTTLYREGDGWHELSNDGSVYEEVAPVQPPEPTAEELETQERQRQFWELEEQINSLKNQLSATDYQIIKTYEYSLVGEMAEYDVEELHTERQALRDRINELESQLVELEKQFNSISA